MNEEEDYCVKYTCMWHDTPHFDEMFMEICRVCDAGRVCPGWTDDMNDG